jgi:hypothetical protein
VIEELRLPLLLTKDFIPDLVIVKAHQLSLTDFKLLQSGDRKV